MGRVLPTRNFKQQHLRMEREASIRIAKANRKQQNGINESATETQKHAMGKRYREDETEQGITGRSRQNIGD